MTFTCARLSWNRSLVGQKVQNRRFSSLLRLLLHFLGASLPAGCNSHFFEIGSVSCWLLPDEVHGSMYRIGFLPDGVNLPCCNEVTRSEGGRSHAGTNGIRVYDRH